MKIQAHGISSDLPEGWEARISLRPTPTGSDTAIGNKGEIPNPTVHLANFALPEQRGDFGMVAQPKVRNAARNPVHPGTLGLTRRADPGLEILT